MEKKLKLQQIIDDQPFDSESEEAIRIQPEQLFDINSNMFNQIRMLFPENQRNYKNQTRSPKLMLRAPKNNGIEVQQLKKILRSHINWPTYKIDQVIANLDHKDQNKITWTEFLEWFTNEGKMRDKIHNAKLYNLGMTRFDEDQMYKLSEKKNDYRVEHMQILNIDNGKLLALLCVFENKEASFYDLKDCSLMKTIGFQSTYKIQSKDKKSQSPRFGRSPLKSTVGKEDQTRGDFSKEFEQSDYFEKFFMDQQSQMSVKRGTFHQVRVEDLDCMPASNMQPLTQNIERRGTLLSVQPKFDKNFLEQRKKPADYSFSFKVARPSQARNEQTNFEEHLLKTTTNIKKDRKESMLSKDQNQNHNQSQSPNQLLKRSTLQSQSRDKRLNLSQVRSSFVRSKDQKQRMQQTFSVVKNSNSKKRKYQILGLDPIEDNTKRFGTLNNDSEHSFSISDKLYFSKFEREENYRTFKSTLKKVDQRIHQNEIQLNQSQQEKTINQTTDSVSFLRYDTYKRPTKTDDSGTNFRNNNNLNSSNYRHQSKQSKISQKAVIDEESNLGEEFRKNMKRILEEKTILDQKKDKFTEKVYSTKEKLEELRDLNNDRVNVRNLKFNETRTRFHQDSLSSSKTQDFILNTNNDKRKPYMLTTSYDEESKVLVFSLIDRQIKLFNISLNRKNLIEVDDFPQQHYIDFICTSIYIKKHKVTQELIAIIGGSDRFEVAIIEGERFGKILVKQYIKLNQHGPLTTLFYEKEAGLITTTFNGSFQNYDAMNFKLVWDYKEVRNQQEKKNTILQSAFSTKQGYLCFGGSEGQIQLFDLSARTKIMQSKKHRTEIISLNFYDQQNQIVSISRDKMIFLWDSNRLEVIQSIKDMSLNVKNITAATFCENSGILVLGFRMVKIYKLKINQKAKVQKLQTEALLRQTFKFQDQDDDLEMKKKRQLLRKQSLKKGKTIMENLKQRLQQIILGKTKVLISEDSYLVSVFVLTEKQLLITIDSDRMLRIWNLWTGEPEKTILLKKLKEGQTQFDKKKVALEYCCIQQTSPYHIAICDDKGFITINNIFSGSVLFNITQFQPIQEVTRMKFVNCKITNLSLIATQSNGYVNFFNQLMPSSDFTGGASKSDNLVSQVFIKKNVHQGDLYAIAISEKYIAIGGLDNKISFWSSLAGTFISVTQLPSAVNEQYKQVFITELTFLKSKENFLIALQNTGDVHIAHPASSKLIRTNFMQTVKNGRLVVNEPIENIVFAISTTGLAETYEIESIQNQFMLKLPKKSNTLSIQNIQGSLNDDLSEVSESGGLHFKHNFELLGKWKAHQIDLKAAQEVVQARIIGEICISATNQGEVKLWGIHGTLMATLGQNMNEQWPQEEFFDKMGLN